MNGGAEDFRGERLCGIVVSDGPGLVLQDAAARLSRRGVGVRYISSPLPEDATNYRLIVLRVRTPEVLTWARRQQRRSGSVVLPFPDSIERIKDRWTCRQLLIPTTIRLPDAMSGTPDALLASGVESLLPLVLKHRKQHGLPVRVVRTSCELREALAAYGHTAELVAERYVEGLHYCACFVGQTTRVFLKPPLVNGEGELKALQRPPAEVSECLSVYRKVSGLNFGKADIVCTAAGEAFLVDAGVSPNLWQLPDGGKLLADHFMTFFDREERHAPSHAQRPIL